MGNLAELKLLPAYHKGQHDIATEFYLPCLSRAISYDRAVGFFNSAIYVIAWPSLKNYVRRGGKMRLVCSPILPPADIAAIREGYEARHENEQVEMLRQEVQRMLQSPYLQKPTRVLASLVAIGAIELRVAYLQRNAGANHQRIFHDKVGILTDDEGNVVVFKGSMNETWSGLSADGNLESVDVFASWDSPKDHQRVAGETEYFDVLWRNEYPTVQVTEFPALALEDLISAADAERWPDLVDEICYEMNAAASLSADRAPGGRIPRPHQALALQEWFARGRRGILEHATGSGKTFTALCAIRDALDRGETPLVLVPSELLLDQWYDEIRETLSDSRPNVLLCGAGHSEWRQDNLASIWTKKSDSPRIVIATMQTAATTDFMRSIRTGEHVFLVADEVHRLGSEGQRHFLQLNTGPRLGLSATPRRANDIDGTRALFDYFAGVVPPPFTLQDAIRSGTLTPYIYQVHQISLTESEQEDWDRVTKRIHQLYAQSTDQAKQDEWIGTQIKHLMIERARIIKSAHGKCHLAVEVLQQQYEPRARWLIYCDSLDQLRDVMAELQRTGLRPMEYHSAMLGDKQQTLRHFEANGGILVSIRCLDEGIDIPAVGHALILASSKNPREFVQRRGRVLRKAPNKSLAFIHDALVVPRDLDPDASSASIVESELVRAIEFGKGAENPGVIGDLQRIALQFGLEYEKLSEGGYEDD